MARFSTTSLAVAAAISILAGTLTAPAPARAADAVDPVTVTPGSIDFGSLAVGSASPLAGVTVQNDGPAPIEVDTVSIDGANAADFSISGDTCTNATLAPGTACTIGVVFTPKGLGARAATLAITGPDPVGARTVPLAGNGTAPSSGVTWGSTLRAGGAYTWTAGNALGRTVQSGTQRLHLAYATDRIGARWAKDGGPYVGVYYTRSTSGAAWSAPKRISPSSRHAPWSGLAASGSRVYATWVTHTKWVHYSPTAPRVLYVRRNTSHGAGSAWKSTVRLTPTRGRVDFPVIAASGKDVHIAYTDSVTGKVRLATSRDRGATWTQKTVGTTTMAMALGRTGMPVVAVDGSTVVVLWVSDATGTLVGRVSTNRGVSWGGVESVGGEANGTPSVAVLGNRIAVSWTTDDAVVVRQRVAGTWGTAKVVEGLGAGEDDYPFASVVTLNGSNRIGVAWAHGLAGDVGTNLRWAESADGGNLWFAAQTLATYNATSQRARNDWASVVWASAGSRYVLWNGYNDTFSNYRQYLRKGSGTPAGPATAAADWVPSGDRTPQRLEGPSDASGPGTTRIRGLGDHPNR